MLGKTRIAPTPSGYLHQGNLFSFTLTWLMARKAGLQILLRIDDMDRARYRSQYVEDIFRSLEALGIDYDEGPQSINDFEKNWSQEKRLPLYNSALKQLQEANQLFACTCSRKDILAHSPANIYPGTCLHKKLNLEGEQRAWRWKNHLETIHIRAWEQKDYQQKLPPEMHYPVLKSKAGYPAYQLSSVIDDLHFGISYIVRGEDLRNSSLLQLAIAENAFFSDFKSIRFHHHPLKMLAGEKLSKSQGAPAALLYRDQNAKQALIDDLSQYLHLPKGANNLRELLDLYRVA